MHAHQFVKLLSLGGRYENYAPVGKWECTIIWKGNRL